MLRKRVADVSNAGDCDGAQRRRDERAKITQRSG
jgi:hypothetical protein